MKKLKLDTGLVTYEIGQGVLRFNPGDPNLYMRFQQAVEQLEQLEKELQTQLQDKSVLTVMAELDSTMKHTLNWVFGPGNDFDAICGGVNLLSADSRGVRLISKLFETLEPVLLAGAKQCAGTMEN